MNDVIEFLKTFDFKTVVSLGAIMWYFTRDIKVSIDRLDEDLRKMNSRLSRLEGTVYGKDVYNYVKPGE